MLSMTPITTMIKLFVILVSSFRLLAVTKRSASDNVGVYAALFESLIKFVIGVWVYNLFSYLTVSTFVSLNLVKC